MMVTWHGSPDDSDLQVSSWAGLLDAVELGLQASQTPFSGCPTFRALAGLPLPARVARLRDPAVRAAILAEDPVADSTFPLLRLLSYDRMYRFGTPPNYTPQAHDSVAATAARTSRPAPEVAYDLLLANAGRDFLYTPIRNYAAPGLAACEELLADRLSIMGLGDGGAHVGFILDAGYPTWLLTYWGRQRGRWPPAELIRRLTSDTADVAGPRDRGRIGVGLKGDLNVIDWHGLDFEPPRVEHDLPAGGARLMQGARGYRCTVVAGRVTWRDGQPTGRCPASWCAACTRRTISRLRISSNTNRAANAGSGCCARIPRSTSCSIRPHVIAQSQINDLVLVTDDSQIADYDCRIL